MYTTHTHTPQELAHTALLAVGAAMHRGPTEGDVACAVTWIMQQYAEDNTGQYTTADYQAVLAAIDAVCRWPRRF